MATPDQLASQVRFQLEQLKAKNQHHNFEHLCRHLTRARICSNVLPATGPVSAGGDQGRDFETFRTHLQESLSHSGGFVGLTSDTPMAFACSLIDSNSAKGKIKDDVRSITEVGQPVDEIHFFCVVDIPVALRHELQEWAGEECNVHLEIHDGQAIAEMLTERDVFWIADRYLNIPADTYPDPPEDVGEQWYVDLLEKWHDSEFTPSNYADFSDLRDAVRHATFNEKAKQDLPFWVNLLETLREETEYANLKRRAIYEISVAQLRGQNSLEGREEILRKYFESIPNLTDINQIEDTVILLIYCSGASELNAVQLSQEELDSWASQLDSKLDSELQAASGSGKKCRLLQIRGYINAIPGLQGASNIDSGKTLDYWEKAVALAEDAPLFPLESFSDLLTELIALGMDSPDLQRIAENVDMLLAERRGGFAAAEKSRDRAIAYRKRGSILRSIRQIHRSKISWFAEETLRGSLLSCLSLSESYGCLGLHFAAKHYALVTASVTLHASTQGLGRFIPRGLVRAAEADYAIGAWCGFINLSDLGLRAFDVYAREEDPTEMNEINRTLFHLINVRKTSDYIAPGLVNLIDQISGLWGLAEEVSELRSHADDAWSSLEEVTDAMSEQGMGGPPWNDIGETRVVRFAALGIQWRFEWVNSFQYNPGAEEFLATLQTILAELASADLCLLRVPVRVSLNFTEKWKSDFEHIPSNEQISWKITLPSVEVEPRKSEDDPSREEITLAAVLRLLSHVSVLKYGDFYSKLESFLGNDLFNKAFFGARYATAYREFMGREEFETCSGQLSPQVPDDLVEPKGHAELQWNSAPGPFYSEGESLDAIRRRYENSVKPIRLTLERLAGRDHFIELVDRLRSEGWKDWHILMALTNIVVNYRVSASLPPSSLDSDQDVILKYMNREEDETSVPIPLDMVTEEAMRWGMKMGMLASLRGLGHEINIATPPFEAVSEFLRERYNYWDLDVEHDDPFE